MEVVNLPGDPDLSLLEQVPWIELSHAYGAALDVPEQIRALVSADKEKRGGLLWGFTSNLFHQGSVYSATVAAIPIFQHLLRYRAVAEKPLILELLANFALGYPEDLDRVDLHEFVGQCDDEDVPTNDDHGRECYLGVAAGVPLYEALLQDENPRTVAAACFLMAFFPAHAFHSCRELLRIAADGRRPDSVRSSALIACSFLDGGAVATEYVDLLAELLGQRSSAADAPVPLLAASAAYSTLRMTDAPVSGPLRSSALQLAEQALRFDVLPPDDGVYPRPPPLDADDLTGYAQQIFNPDEKFPWGDLVVRLARITEKQSPALDARRQRQQTRRQRQRLDPTLYNVQPGVFDRDNVLAAVRRMHAWLDLKRDGVPQEALDEFERFKPHLDLVWDEIVRLLDSNDRFISSAAQSLVHRAQPLSAFAIQSLIDRLHNDDTRLAEVLKKHPLPQQQCQEMCDRLVSGRCSPGFGHNQHTYREIVCKQGTPEQVWQLFDQGEDGDRTWACRELIERGLLDAHDPRVYDVEAADCMSGDPGRYIAARFSFAQSTSHQAWFFSHYAEIDPPRRWAVVQAMELFRADLTPHEDSLRSTIANEESALLKAKLIRLMSHFNPVTPQHVEYLLSRRGDPASPIERSAVATTLGNWLGRGLDDRIVPELLALTSDESTSVRRIALQIVARGRGPDWRDDDDQRAVDIAGAASVLRRALGDVEQDVRRLAICELYRRKEWEPDDLNRAWVPLASDRVCSEGVLAAALSAQPGRFNLAERRADLPAGCPLTASVLSWATRRV